MKIAEKLSVDRAHRVGKPRPEFGGSKVRSQPRPIVVRFHHGKVKEKVMKAAREIKPDGLKFYEDFSQRILQRRKKLIPELIKIRKQGKKAFLVMDRIVEYDDDANDNADNIK